MLTRKRAQKMEDERIAKEAPLVEDPNSKSSFAEVGESSNMGKDSHLIQTEVAEKQVEDLVEDLNIVECHSPTSVIHIDLTKYFETDKEFESREAVVQWCQEVGRKNNSVLVIAKTSTSPAIKGSSVELRCERGGVYHSRKRDGQSEVNNKRKREVTSKKCGCPFKLRSSCKAINSWALKVTCGMHNHELPEIAAPARLKEEEKELLLTLSCSGVRPRQVFEALKQNNKENLFTMKTIYNLKARLKGFKMDERLPMRQLMKFLAEHEYVEYNNRDPNSNELTNIFWTHQEASMLAQCFPSVVIIDIYKTNRFKMPLFQAVGMTSTNKYFTVAFAFLQAETEENYTWALTNLKTMYGPNLVPSVFVTNTDISLINGINIVFPGAVKILCTWHIENTIQENCKKSFDKEEMWEKFFSDWKYVCQAESKSKYSDSLTNFVSKWAGTHGACISYICEACLVQKESFVCAWVNKIKHYGNTTLKRIEGENAKVNAWLGTSHRNFLNCWEGMHKMFQNEHVEIKASFDMSSTSVKNSHQILPFKELRYNVSQKAMDYILDEMEHIETVKIDVASCRCVIRKTHGLPCAHELVQYVEESTPIPLSAIDQQWKQLCSISILKKRVGFDFLPELQLIRQRWIEGSEMERKAIVEEMNEIGTPSSIPI